MPISAFDHVLPSGQKLQYSASEDVALQRPGGLYVEWNGDLGDRQFWYDGKSVTLYDPADSVLCDRRGAAGHRRHAGQARPPVGLRTTAGRLSVSATRTAAVRGNVQYGFYLGHERRERQKLPHARLRREGHRLADLDRQRAATDPVQAGDHLQDAAVAAAVHRGVHRLGFRAAHRRAGVHAGAAARGLEKIPFETVSAAK